GVPLARRARRDARLPGRGRRAGRDAETARLVSAPTSYLLERAWVDGLVQDDVLVEIEDSRFTSVTSVTDSSRFPGVATARERGRTPVHWRRRTRPPPPPAP